MKNQLRNYAIAGVLMALIGPLAAATENATPSTKADNTAINARDKSGATVTAADQDNNSIDLKVEADVRSAIVGDKSLSVLAHNIKVVTADGVVTLRGPVQSVAEKTQVARLAMKTPGVVRVDNQLDVKRQ